MSDWQTTDTAPDGVIVMTKIDDANGVRNDGALYRSGNLWFVPDGSMYVYYRPTHWRKLTRDERHDQEVRLMAGRLHKMSEYDRAFKRLPP